MSEPTPPSPPGPPDDANAAHSRRTEAAFDPSAPIPAWRRRFLDRLEAGGHYRGWVLFTALAGMFATTFPVTILTISLSSIADEFGSTESTIAWVISAPMLLSAVTFPLLGKLGDLRGHRTLFLAGFSGATIVAALTATAWDAPSLIGFRTLAAILGGATQPTAMALIFAVYPPNERVRAMGWWSMTTAAAPALGLALGGPLVDLLGWRVVFLFQAVLSALALALAVLVLRETPRKRVGFDLAGSIALALGIGGFMFALGNLRDIGSGASTIWISLIVGGIALVAFTQIEKRVKAPLLPLEFFRSRNFTSTLLTNALTSGGYMGAFVIAPFFLFDLGFSKTTASFLILMRTATLTIASPLGGRLGERMGERFASVFGCTVMTVGLVVAAWTAATEYLPGFIVGLVLQGAGHGLSQPSITAAISHSVDESDLGIAAASNRLMGQGGAAFGITLLTLTYSGFAPPQAFYFAFLAGAVLSALSVVTALFMGSEHIELEHPPST